MEQEQDGGDIAETIMARSYEKGYNDGVKQKSTLRDQFAMAALVELMDQNKSVPASAYLEACSSQAYEMADAMLLARNQTEG